ncbi:WXG100 family type VII secretion target [Arthrobacter sp. ZGTC131]|uniref:WXG100 family type VII secretion target n=1 Tax=Arthrobacter sp. ZGTC131 TaxID=2058898 RepID=UPI000CE4C6E0|nr:WXG100 family type VII secretion target [Arthrobacter sp. ZGTC131]
MAFWGADTDQLKTLSTKLQQGSAEIEKQKSALSSALIGTEWKGPDADRFRSDWESQHAANLAKIAQALEEASRQVSQNAQQQEDASHR